MASDELTGWLIEHGGMASPLYWTGESWGKWSADHKRACRFARREDAHKVSLCLGDMPHDPPHRVVEHAWDAPAASLAREGEVERVARAVRRDQFRRTGTGRGQPDEELPLTESELANARAAIEALSRPQGVEGEL